MISRWLCIILRSYRNDCYGSPDIHEAKRDVPVFLCTDLLQAQLTRCESEAKSELFANVVQGGLS